MGGDEKKKLAIAEYEALLESSSEKSEYYKGEVFAMSGGTRNHSLISANFLVELRHALGNENCTVFDSNLKVRVQKVDATYFPDVTVVCGTEKYANENQTTLLNPNLVVEVLSDSTEAFDRGLKFRNYAQLESLETIVLVSQKTPLVEVYSRTSENSWELVMYPGTEAIIRLQVPEIQIRAQKLYHRVEFEEGV